MNNKVNMPNRYLTKIMLAILRLLLNFKSHIEVYDNDIKKLKPPYIIISNHVNNWDPFYININLDHPISYVTSDRFFRNKLLKLLLNYVGAIPKTKFKSDFKTIKKIIEAKKRKRIIGIFPEGNRSWDGKTGKLIFSTVKLIKLLKVPVVCVNIKGGYLSQPRWSKSYRKGKVLISYNLVLTEEDVNIKNEDEIYNVLNENLLHDEYDFQKKYMYSYKGKKIAENLELFIFICPKCKQIDTMSSKNNEFHCTSCGYSVFYLETGFFINKYKKIYFDNPRDWNEWQLENLKVMFEKGIRLNDILLKNKDAIIHKASNIKDTKKIYKGILYLVYDSLNFNGNENLYFKISKINGLNVQSNNIIEFYYNDNLYKITFMNPKISVYKWVMAIKILLSRLDDSKLKNEKEIGYE